jgi:hypothetical protein
MITSNLANDARFGWSHITLNNGTIQARINKGTYWLQKRLQIWSDEFRIALHLTEYTTQSAG